MRGRTGVAFFVAVLLPLGGCVGNPPRNVPGLAHPAAVAETGFRLVGDARLHDYKGVNLVLPPGWTTGGSASCLVPPGADPQPGGECPNSALHIRSNAVQDGIIDAEGADLDDPKKWRRPWAACPGGSPTDGPVRTGNATITDSGGFALVSGEQARFSEWTVPCTDGVSFRTLVWFVAEAGLEFDVPVAQEDAYPGYAAIVHSADLSGYEGD
ncbi:hypothetical protein [Nocardiopsis ansamitocini]|uniref:Uncharacterized protein n=1 Tax=Nocardiopsis ansamitocini TaxID=1670832 RepID=A0A9W6UHY7_9ACTN|nr:hypothetical protein [Nocardiopsis ansamitocini]GLU46848.1 hypothetical protein Nans01_11990 [Nocardiopsis ansamitocini]